LATANRIGCWGTIFFAERLLVLRSRIANDRIRRRAFWTLPAEQGWSPDLFRRAYTR
jgi:hypothetical protein